MNKLDFKVPYDDNKLIFNKDTEKYELTIEYVKNNFDVTFADDGILKQRITKNSRKIYNFIKYRSYSGNQAMINLLLNFTEMGRKFLLDVLTEEIEADLASGYNDLSSTPAINFANGSDKDRNELQRNQISVDAEQIIENCVSYFGFNIMAQTRFPQNIINLFILK